VTMDIEFLLTKTISFPHVFKILPTVEGRPQEEGTWAAYNNDHTTTVWVNTSHVEAQRFYKENIEFEEEKRMSQALTVTEDKAIKSLIAGNIKAIKSVLPKHLTPERAARIFYTALTRNPTLARCTHASLANGIIEASMLGLEISSPLSEASLIPFKNNKRGGVYEATIIIEYGGLIKLAHNSPSVKDIKCRPVHENDEFDYSMGSNEYIRHKKASKNRGRVVGAYAIVKYHGGGEDMEVIGEEEAMAAKDDSAAKYKNDSPWNKKQYEPMMWAKTALRRLMKRVPKSAEIIRAFDVDEKSEDLSHVIDINFDELEPINLGDKPENTPPPETKNKPEPAKKEAPKKEVEKPKIIKISGDADIFNQLGAIKEMFPEELLRACEENNIFDISKEEDAKKIFRSVNMILDSDNS